VQAEVAVEHVLDERDAAFVEDMADLFGAEFGPFDGFAVLIDGFTYAADECGV